MIFYVRSSPQKKPTKYLYPTGSAPPTTPLSLFSGAPGNPLGFRGIPQKWNSTKTQAFSGCREKAGVFVEFHFPEFRNSGIPGNRENPRGFLAPPKPLGFSWNSAKVEFRENRSLFQPLAPPWARGWDPGPRANLRVLLGVPETPQIQ